MQVPVVRTVASPRDYARAFIRAWRHLYPDYPTQEQCGVLYAQWIVETSGRHFWNFNVGNVKVTQAQIAAGVSWIDLPGTWEIIAGKRVVLRDGHPGRRFRAFSSLDEAMREHLAFLRRRFATCWPCVEAGDPDAFAHALKAGRDGVEGTSDDYFTADANDYARIMVAAHAQWMRSPAFADALSEVVNAAERPTEPAIANPSSDPPFAIVYAMPRTVPDDEPPDAA